MASLATWAHACAMKDPLFARAQLAIEESHAVRKQRNALLVQHANSIRELRQAVRRSVTTRSEIKAQHDDEET